MKAVLLHRLLCTKWHAMIFQHGKARSRDTWLCFLGHLHHNNVHVLDRPLVFRGIKFTDPASH